MIYQSYIIVPENRKAIVPKIINIEGKKNGTAITIEPCGLYMIQCVAKPFSK